MTKQDLIEQIRIAAAHKLEREVGSISKKQAEAWLEPVQIGEYMKWDDGDCLCPCDIEKTAEAAGCSVSPGWETVGCDWLMTPNDQVQQTPACGRSAAT